jgi:HSP20 family molecular chaperone IbpA
MQPTRIVTPRLCKAVSAAAGAAPRRNLGMMTFPFIPQSIASDMAPLLRMLDHPPHPRARRWAQSRQLAAPRFDVRERNVAYELQGELPGLRQEDVTIEFSDPHTLVIRGKVERQRVVTNMDEPEQPQVALQEGENVNMASGSEGENASKEATVEDEYVDAGAEVQGDDPSVTATTDAVKTDADTDVTKKTDEPEREKYKYWVSERVVGGFERHFKFPSDVNQEAVKASLRDGILSVVVPKIVKSQKKIVVE